MSAPEREDRRAGRSRSRAVYSALDLGTNNCRLLIARPARNGFRVIDAFSRIVRLGEGLSQSGALSDAAMTRAIAALDICARKIRRRRVTCMRAVATEACRSAANREAFLRRVKAETGLNLDIISAAEEARLAVVGCQALLDPSCRDALVFDIGGGSTELILVRRTGPDRLRIRGWISIPFGVVNVAERFGLGRLHEEDVTAIIALLHGEMEDFRRRMGNGAAAGDGELLLLGTSGTVTTLASLALGLPRYDRARVDGVWLALAEMRRLAREVALMDHEARRRQPCIGDERADYVAAGCGILAAILDAWPATRLRVADRGIREGILRGLMGISHLESPRRRARGAG
ncbi:MAG: Ppx/GppA phosphatase family protein [Rhodothalassiaceae bacterium]